MHAFVHNCIVIYTCLKISKFYFFFHKSSCIAITFLFITPFYLVCLISLNCSSAEKPCDVILFASTTFLSPFHPLSHFLSFLTLACKLSGARTVLLHTCTWAQGGPEFRYFTSCTSPASLSSHFSCTDRGT